MCITRTIRSAACAVLIGVALIACTDRGTPDSVSVSGSCEDIDLSEAPDEPTVIRLAYAAVAQEITMIQFTDPDFSQSQYDGVWYTVDATMIADPTNRVAAYQAGDLDAVGTNFSQLAVAVSSGLPLAFVALDASETGSTFASTYVALEDSGINTVEDLEGKTLGIIGPQTAFTYWLYSALANAGLDNQNDVSYATVPLPSMEQALRQGQVDLVPLSEPFYSNAMAEGGLVEVFTSVSGTQIDPQPLGGVAFDRNFIDENPGVVCAWAADFEAAAVAYEADRRGAIERLVDAGLMVVGDLDAYLQTADWSRDPRIDTEAVDRILLDMVESGFFPDGGDLSASDLIVEGYSLTTD